MTIVKICGLRSIEHLLAAATAGADWLGLVLAPSRRQVTAAEAATLVRALRAHPAGQDTKVVGLFVNESATQINALAAACSFDYVQLSGTETPEQARDIVFPVIKALRLDASPLEAAWLKVIADCGYAVGTVARSSTPIRHAASNLSFAPCPILVDAHVAGAYGGTGTMADWERAALLARQQPIMLAGGLSPENVAMAIARVRPWGVDVSSGVEHNGGKDPARIEAFVGAVRAVA